MQRKRSKRRRGGAKRNHLLGSGESVGSTGGSQASQGNGARRRRGRRSRQGRAGGGDRSGSRHGGRARIPTRPNGEPTLKARGVLEPGEGGIGRLRSPGGDYRAEPGDPVVPARLIGELGLEAGVELETAAIPPSRPGGAPWVEVVEKINGLSPEDWSRRRPFRSLVAEDPTERIRLESSPDEISTRVVDLIAPIGKGQRCLIVAPPKAGKTVLLQKIAHSISANHPEIHLIVLLVDERPEEVTDMRRNVQGEVVASSADEPARDHVRVAEMVLERARRLVEAGGDVVILLDSITRLSRAYNTLQRSSGRVLSGGVDARTMERPRRFFGAARNVHQGGSLTVIGTALVDTGSRMDEVIFQEFKGTGNTEIVMDRSLFDRRVFPALDISKTGTRKEEKLYTPEEYAGVTLLRRALAPLRAAEAMQLLVERLARFPSNAEFLASLHNA